MASRNTDASQRLYKAFVRSQTIKLNQHLLSILESQPNVEQIPDDQLFQYLNYVIGFSLAGDFVTVDTPVAERTPEKMAERIAEKIPNTVWLFKMMKILLEKLRDNPESDTKQLTYLLQFSLGTYVNIFHVACQFANFLTDEALNKYEIKKLVDEIKGLYDEFQSSENEKLKVIVGLMNYWTEQAPFSGQKYNVQQIYDKFNKNLSERHAK
jgi:hypothetical protein